MNDHGMSTLPSFAGESQLEMSRPMDGGSEE